MAEPFSLIKAIDITPAALGKSTSVVLKGLLVLAIIGLLGLGLWIVVKPHFIKPVPTTGITGDVQTLNQDCSPQVCAAIKDWESMNRKSSPWIELRFWKLLKIGIGGT